MYITLTPCYNLRSLQQHGVFIEDMLKYYQTNLAQYRSIQILDRSPVVQSHVCTECTV